MFDSKNKPRMLQDVELSRLLHWAEQNSFDHYMNVVLEARVGRGNLKGGFAFSRKMRTLRYLKPLISCISKVP